MLYEIIRRSVLKEDCKEGRTHTRSILLDNACLRLESLELDCVLNGGSWVGLDYKIHDKHSSQWEGDTVVRTVFPMRRIGFLSVVLKGPVN